MLSTSFLLVFRGQANLDADLTNTAERRIRWFFKEPGAIQWWHHEIRHSVPKIVEAEVERWLTKNA